MNKILFITRMYVSKFLVATMLTYVYLANACPSCEGTLEKNSPAFFSEELENAEEDTMPMNHEAIDETESIPFTQE